MHFVNAEAASVNFDKFSWIVAITKLFYNISLLLLKCVHLDLFERCHY